MKLFAILATIGGLLLAMGLVLAEGAGAIWRSAALIGAGGFTLLIAYRLFVIASMGVSWWVLGRARGYPGLPRYVWGRLIRDSAAEALPLSQIGGFVIGARALTLTGVDGSFAAASTVVDVTAELFGQLVYVSLGLFLLHQLRPGSGIVAPALGATLAMAAAVSIFLLVQARGFGLAERAVRRLAAVFVGAEVAESSGVREEITALHHCRAALLTCALLHVLWWIESGLETWFTFHLMGLRIGVAPAIVVDSFLYGVRSIAFVVPNAFGVQEGVLIILAGLFGVAPAPALALSFIKRARDLMIGIPPLLAWQILEGRRAWRAEPARK